MFEVCDIIETSGRWNPDIGNSGSSRSIVGILGSYSVVVKSLFSGLDPKDASHGLTAGCVILPPRYSGEHMRFQESPI